jgi:DeoR/GlpR family transcriptional regulator of sugar metabolism
VDSAARGETRARRQAQIVEYLAAHREASLAELADRFGVSQMTVYRDVEHLERMAAVRRVPGGVTSQPSTVFESNLQYRQTVQLAEKQAIARAAVKLVEPGMSIMLDDGTTIAPMLPELRTKGPLTVISGFRPVLDALRGADNVNVIVLGGLYREQHDCVVGVLAEEMIRSLRADLFFLSSAAIDQGAILHQEQEMVQVKRAMMASAQRRVLLTDHTKLGRTATHRVADVEEFDHIYVDERATDAQLAHITCADVDVTIVAV